MNSDMMVRQVNTKDIFVKNQCFKAWMTSVSLQRWVPENSFWSHIPWRTQDSELRLCSPTKTSQVQCYMSCIDLFCWISSLRLMACGQSNFPCLEENRSWHSLKKIPSWGIMKKMKWNCLTLEPRSLEMLPSIHKPSNDSETLMEKFLCLPFTTKRRGMQATSQHNTQKGDVDSKRKRNARLSTRFERLQDKDDEEHIRHSFWNPDQVRFSFLDLVSSYSFRSQEVRKISIHRNTLQEEYTI